MKPKMNDQTYYMRSTDSVVVTSRDGLLLVGAGGTVINHATTISSQWSQLMQLLASPTSGDLVLKHTIDLPERDRALLERLLVENFILEDHERDSLAGKRDKIFSENQCFYLVPEEPVCQHLIVACTGSILAGLMAPTLLSLCYTNFQQKLDVILTQTALKFFTRDLMESYGIRTWVDSFERRDHIYVPHVHLARSADCILVMPASANSLHRLADGACTDLLSMLVAATHAPVVLAPAMNEAMWNNSIIQRNVQSLREHGMYVIEPTVIFGAADLANQGQPMYGGHGTIWTGPHSLMTVLSEILRSQNGNGRLARGEAN